MVQIPGRGDGPVPTGAAETADEVLRLQGEIDALRGRLSRRLTIRTWLSNTFIVLTVVAMIASMVAIWARSTVYDTDRFMEVVEPALDDPAFYTALSDRVADQSLEALDLTARVSVVLDDADAFLSEALIDAIDPDPRALARLQAFDRPTLASLAPPIASALEDRVVAIIDRFITSEEFQLRFPGLVRQVHAGGVALLTGDEASLPNVYTDNGEVRLDTVPIVVEALEQVASEIRGFLPDITLPAPVAATAEQGREQLRSQLAQALDTELPEDFGQVTLMTESALAGVQEAVRQTDRLVWVIALLALALLGLSILVSPDRRRSVITLALGVAAGTVLTMLLVRRLETALLDQIVSLEGKQAVQQAYGALASNLRTVAVLVAITAIVISIVAYLVGRPAWVTDLGRRWARLTAATNEGSELDRWVAARFDLLRLAGIAVALAVMVLTGLELLLLLIIGPLLGLYLWAIAAARQRIADLQPDVPPGTAGIEESRAHEKHAVRAASSDAGAEEAQPDP